MKKIVNILATLALLLAPALYNPGQAQYREKNYGETPDQISPYANYPNAYKKHFLTPLPFRGAGREKPEPVGLKTVRIGFLGPLENSKDVAMGKQMLQASTLAIEQANANGGFRGTPFELMLHNDVGLWGAAANEVVKMDEEGCWGIIGSLNDIVTHVAIRIALKLEIPLISGADPDPTLTETNIPWVMRTISDDRQSSYALANQIFKVDGYKKVSLLRVNNRYGRVGTGEFKDAAVRMGHPVGVEMRFLDGDKDFTDQLNTIKGSNADCILLWGDAKDLGAIVNQMRKMGMKQPVYACDRVVSPEFLQVAGSNADGVVSTCQYNPKSDNPKLKKFREDYKKRFNMEPDVLAVHTYDATNIMIDAIRRAGLNRALIRDVMLDLKTYQNYQGVSGEIVFDATWTDVGQIYMSRIKGSDFIITPYTFKKETISGSIK